MTAARVLVWRHGRTAWNHERRMQGQVDVPLDEVGVDQARAAAAVLRAYRPVRLVASDLSRAARTAEALAERTGLEIEYDQDLREVDTGSWGGLLVSDVRERFPQLYERVASNDPDVRRGGDGETLRELADRAEKALRRAAEGVADGETVVVASHGLAAKVGVGQLIGLPAESWGALVGMENCAWAELGWRDGGWQLAGWNLRVGPGLAPAEPTG